MSWNLKLFCAHEVTKTDVDIYAFRSYKALMWEQPIHVGADNKDKRVLLQGDFSYGGLG